MEEIRISKKLLDEYFLRLWMWEEIYQFSGNLPSHKAKTQQESLYKLIKQWFRAEKEWAGDSILLFHQKEKIDNGKWHKLRECAVWRPIHWLDSSILHQFHDRIENRTLRLHQNGLSEDDAHEIPNILRTNDGS